MPFTVIEVRLIFILLVCAALLVMWCCTNIVRRQREFVIDVRGFVDERERPVSLILRVR